jgi:N-acetyl sugar amidotransferase
MPRYCRNCVLPDTRPGVHLGPEGICNGCRNARIKAATDWSAREAAFRELVERAKSRRSDYDCVIPVSGGKDSYWQVVTCLRHGLRPLCVTYVFPGRTALGEHNLRNLVRLGVHHLEIRVNPVVERRFILKAFRRTGISGLPAHMAIAAVPVTIAAKFDIPLVVYGENSAFEYGSEDQSLTGPKLDRRWLEAFGVTAGTTAEDWIDEELTRQDLAPFFFPPAELLERKPIDVVFLGYYFPWDVENSREVASRHGFEGRSEGARVGAYDYANIDDDFIAVHHHPKWHKFGITRSWDNLAIEIRSGRLTRDAAVALLQKRGDETPWSDIRLFSAYLGISTGEYFRIVESFRNPEIWSRRGGKWVIEGFLIPNFPWPEDPPLD